MSPSHRSPTVAVAAFVVAAVASADPRSISVTPVVIDLSAVTCQRLSPNSTLTDIFKAPPPVKKKRDNKKEKFIGLIPKSELMRFARGLIYKETNKTKYSDDRICCDVASRRKVMRNHFHHDNSKRVHEEQNGSSLCLSLSEIDNWIIDNSVVEMSVSDHRRLSRYPTERLLLYTNKTRLLLLVDIDNNKSMFGGIASKMNETQENEIWFISGRRYIEAKPLGSYSKYF